MQILSIDFIVLEAFGYPMSFIELFATIFGLISVFLASRANIFTWPTGIANEFGFFILFYQVQLYASMLLQVYFFVMTMYGWYFWHKHKSSTQDQAITSLPQRHKAYLLILLVLGTIIFGLIAKQLHLLLPAIFSEPASHPFTDAFITVASIAAMVLLARKVLDSWILWVSLDIVAAILYTVKGVYLVAIEYLIFLGLASYGYFHWKTLQYA